MKCRKNFIQSFLVLIFILSANLYVSAEESIFHFDFDHFVGQRIIVKEIYSPKIDKLILNLTVTDGYKILTDANPFIEVFTKNKGLIKKFLIKSGSNTFKLGQIIADNNLYVEMDLFYCREGSEGMCLVKKVLFDIPISESSTSKNINLSYQIL